MKVSLQQALDNTNTVYGQLVEIANDIIESYTTEVDTLINLALNNIENLTNDMIRDLMLKLSLKSYCFSEVKEKSSLKAECAETLRKEAFAKAFNGAEGSVGAKENTAIINTSDEILVESIYTLVSSLFKTKLDEVHRVVDTLKTILMSRMSEAKLVSE